jgi:PAS domain S-box-containing protein
MGLAHWRNGNLINYKDATGSIGAILEDRVGTIWIARAVSSDAKGPLCKVTDTGVRCYGGDDGIKLPYAVALANDSLGNLWLAGGTMVSLWQTSSADTYVSAGLNPELFNGVVALAGRPDGSLWVGQEHAGKGGGLQQLAHGAWKPFLTPEFDSSTLEVAALLLDRDSSLWIGTLTRGIYHIQGNKVDRFGSSDGLSGDAVGGIFQDREGNIWIATSRGIDNLRDIRVASFSTRQGLGADPISVLASRDGTVWVGNHKLGALRSGKITSIGPRDGLPGLDVTSLLEDRAGRLWVGVDEGLSVYDKGKFKKIDTRDGGPLGAIVAMTEDVDGSIWAQIRPPENASPPRLIRIQDRRIREEISSPPLPAVNTLTPDPHGGIWFGLASGGLARYRYGQMEFFPFNHSFYDGTVHGLLVSSDASVLAATPSGLVGWQNGRPQSLTVRNGLPCDVVYALISDRKATLWLYTACGLIAIPNAELQRWWASPEATVKSRLFDVFDGAQPMSTPFRPNASQSPDGRLWFVNENVLQMIDPDRMGGNPLVPPVHIEQIIADHKSYAPRDSLRLPALTRDLEIDYTALSFVAPQKVRFRYKMEGRDSEWQDPGTRRQAYYADLRPGEYRFRVIGCNNDGVWNEEGATLAFSLAAAWFQTWWFRGVCLAAFLALLAGLYQLRIHQLQRQEKQLRDVINTVPANVWSTSPDGAVDFVNERWQELTGLTPENALGWNWEAVVHPDDQAGFVVHWHAAVKDGHAMDHEVRVRRADGEYRWLFVRNVPLRDKRGNIVKWYGTSIDIDDRKRAEEALRRAQADLSHINRVNTLGELAASISHELKQPIAAAIMDANTCSRSLARAEPDLQEAREATLRVVNDNRRAVEIIDRLRSLYKKAGPPARHVVDVNEIAREMLVLLYSEANRYSISMRLDLAAELPKTKADRVQLQQVFMNLMLNGIEAMKDTSGELTIKSEPTDDGQLLISVSDTGVGLPSEKLGNIFDSFFTTKAQGTGMGLSITRTIIESHGGRLWATANSGRGARFHFTLPAEARALQMAPKQA